jgi:hypothetical protein
MRHIIKVLALSFIVAACGQNDNKQKELELKERELALKEKELALKEKDTANLKKQSAINDTIKKKSITVEKDPQIPKDGNYIYSFVDMEMNNSVTAKCNVTIKGYSFTYQCSGIGSFTGGGIIKKNKKSGEWMIIEGEDETIVDFKKKEIYGY